jgi:predicted DNA-binding transcriptional regulator AlpA
MDVDETADVNLWSRTMSTKQLLTTAEAAAVLGVREATLIAWRSRGTAGRPQPVRLGTRSVRYRQDDVLAYRDRETSVRPWTEKKSRRRGS